MQVAMQIYPVMSLFPVHFLLQCDHNPPTLQTGRWTSGVTCQLYSMSY